MTHEDPALNYKTVCKMLNIGKTTFYELINKGEFPKAFRVGPRGIRVPLSDIQTFMEKSRRQMSED